MASVPFHKSGPSNDEDIPPFEYAEYLTRTVILHVGSVYHLFNETKFQERMAQSYVDGFVQDQADDLWLAQFLLVMALGKLILGRGASALGPPGATEFLRAMKKVPDISFFSHDNPVAQVETICLASLYLLSADMRTTAYALVCPSSGISSYLILTKVHRSARRNAFVCLSA
jgi:proline utilization trans-activator